MKGKRRWFLISAALVLGMCLAGTGTSWGGAADLNPLPAAASPDAQTVVAQAASTNTEAPAQTTTPQAAAPSTTTTTTAPAQTNVPVTEVTVTAEKEKAAKEGSAEVGYKVENVETLGPWPERKLLDTPYSISVIPQEMIQNTVSPDADQVFKMDPLTKPFYKENSNGNSDVYMRGFWVQTNTLDGIQLPYYNYDVFVEDLERIEVYSGAAGFMYGVGAVGGQINYISKKPTPYYLNDVTVGDFGGSNLFVHGDFSGPIDKQGKFAYRLNVLDQGGETAIDGQAVRRQFASGTVDYHILNNLTLEVNSLFGYYRADRVLPNWGFAASSTLTRIPSAPDADHIWAPDGTYNEVETRRLKPSLQYDINDTFTFRAAYLYEDDLRQTMFAGDTITSPTRYRMTFGAVGFRYVNQGAYSYLDAKFDTFGIKHTLTGGFNVATAIDTQWRGTTPAPATLMNLDLSNPSSASSVVFPSILIQDNPTPATRYYVANRSATTNYLIGDDIKFSDRWSALIGVNDALVQTGSVSNALVRTGYDKNAYTPTASLLFKPVKWVTTYATYIESLEQGTVVGPTYKNAGAVLDPLVDRQYEVGAKAEVGKMLLTAALFEIDKANQYSDDGTIFGTLVQDGRQVHRGIEFTATGKVIDDLTLWGGATLMHAAVERTNTPSLEGKEPTDVAEFSAKAYAEYNLPFLRGLTLTGGAYYTGPSYADSLNTLQLPGYTTGDIGARYTTQVFGKDTIYRLNVTNVLNRDYWLSSRQLGSPRTIALSATVRF